MWLNWTNFVTHLVHDDNLLCPDDGAEPVSHDQACPLFARTFYRTLDMSENKSSSKSLQCMVVWIQYEAEHWTAVSGFESERWCHPAKLILPLCCTVQRRSGFVEDHQTGLPARIKSWTIFIFMASQVKTLPDESPGYGNSLSLSTWQLHPSFSHHRLVLQEEDR